MNTIYVSKDKLEQRKKEKDRLLEMLDSHMTRKALKGTYDNRWSVLQAIYHAYLIGIGYDNFNWRED